MGCFHGVEVCELVGLYLLQKLVSRGLFPKHLVGLYLDDGLGVIEVQRDNFRHYKNIR